MRSESRGIAGADRRSALVDDEGLLITGEQDGGDLPDGSSDGAQVGCAGYGGWRVDAEEDEASAFQCLGVGGGGALLHQIVGPFQILLGIGGNLLESLLLKSLFTFGRFRLGRLAAEPVLPRPSPGRRKSRATRRRIRGSALPNTIIRSYLVSSRTVRQSE